MPKSEKIASILDEYPDRVMPEPNSGCWFWTGATARGYGVVRRFGVVRGAHRVAFLLENGYLPPRPSYHHKRHLKALVLDHLCRNRACCNPDHLQVVTMEENKRRGYAHKKSRPPKTHCKRGHPLSGDNLYINPANGGRVCRACRVIRQRRYSEMRRAKRADVS